jgi:hypoxanthine phosphoribosyltransferase
MAVAEAVEVKKPYGEIIVTEAQVDHRITQMAEHLRIIFKGMDPVFISLLNGANPFFSKLMFEIARQDENFHPQAEFMTISRYRQRRHPGASAKIVMNLPPEYRNRRRVLGKRQEGALEGRVAVPLDDMRDKGGTLKVVDGIARRNGAADVVPVTLGLKEVPPEEIEYDVEPIYGFNLPDVWVTGMGGDDSNVAPNANRYAGWIATAQGITLPDGWHSVTPGWVSTLPSMAGQPPMDF